MAYLPEDLPGPQIDDINAGFWEACNQRRLCFQTCTACGQRTHPPLPACPHCQSQRFDWTDAPARGRVFSLVWVWHAAHPSLRGIPLPYNVVVVEFADAPGVRLVSNVVDAREGGLHIGDAVELAWEQSGGQWLPRFRLAG
ncbi:MAG: Zn-ribbon domain-containing OB-fold protein [Lautropia sp.]